MHPDDERHPFWQYRPVEDKTARARWSLQLRRGLAWMAGRRQRIGLVIGIYLVTWIIPAVLGQPLITLFALIPLVLVPPVGWLVYQLVWKEFHE